MIWPADTNMNHVNALLRIRDTMRHLKRNLSEWEASVKSTLKDDLHCVKVVRACPKMVDKFFYHFKGLSALADTFEEWSVQSLEELKETRNERCQ